MVGELHRLTELKAVAVQADGAGRLSESEPFN